MQALEARLGGITGAFNEDLDVAAKQYRQSIFKLNYKIKLIQVQMQDFLDYTPSALHSTPYVVPCRP